MPKQRGALRFKGKDKKANKQYAETASGFIVKELPRAGIHKNQEAIKKNYTAAPGVNKLAGQVNTVMKFYATDYLERRRIDPLKSLFFKEGTGERLGRLKSIEGMDGHTRNKLSERMNLPEINLSVKKDKIILPVHIRQHPEIKSGKQYFHYLRIILILWNSKDDSYTHQSKRTDWIAINDELPLEYEFAFEKKLDSAEWLIMLCLARGEERNEDRMPPDKALRIVKAGSFDKKAVARYESALAERQNKQEVLSKKTALDDVVMPKKAVKKVELKKDVAVPKKKAAVKKSAVKKKVVKKKEVVKKKGS